MRLDGLTDQVSEDVSSECATVAQASLRHRHQSTLADGPR
jgi:hypothetical protein